MNWFDEESLVRLISFISIVSTAVFASIGTATDLKKDGSLTTWGRAVLAGAAISAALAMSTTMLQYRIADASRDANEKAAATQRADEQGRFATQVKALATLNDQMRQANTTNQSILAGTQEAVRGQGRLLSSQDVLLTNARESLIRANQASEQQRQDTATLIDRIWLEANRVDPAQIWVGARTVCDLPEGQSAPPIYVNARANFVLIRRDDAAELNANGPRAYGIFLLHLVASSQSRTVRDQLRSIERGQVFATSFSDFVAMNIDSISNIDFWRSARIMLTLKGDFSPELQRVAWAPTQPPEPGARIGLDAVQRYLPCQVRANVGLGGREIASDGPRRLAVVRDSVGQLHLAVEFPSMAVENGALPRRNVR